MSIFRLADVNMLIPDFIRQTAHELSVKYIWKQDRLMDQYLFMADEPTSELIASLYGERELQHLDKISDQKRKIFRFLRREHLK